MVTGGGEQPRPGDGRRGTAARVIIADVQDDLGRAVAADLACCYTRCDVTDELRRRSPRPSTMAPCLIVQQVPACGTATRLWPLTHLDAAGGPPRDKGPPISVHASRVHGASEGLCLLRWHPTWQHAEEAAGPGVRGGTCHVCVCLRSTRPAG